MKGHSVPFQDFTSSSMLYKKLNYAKLKKNNQSFCCVFLQQSVPLHKVLDDMAQGRPIKVAFVKKTWKVPSKEIARAEALREKYYESIDE